jgi:hypothetical protein
MTEMRVLAAAEMDFDEAVSERQRASKRTRTRAPSQLQRSHALARPRDLICYTYLQSFLATIFGKTSLVPA